MNFGEQDAHDDVLCNACTVYSTQMLNKELSSNTFSQHQFAPPLLLLAHRPSTALTHARRHATLTNRHPTSAHTGFPTSSCNTCSPSTLSATCSPTTPSRCCPLTRRYRSRKGCSNPPPHAYTRHHSPPYDPAAGAHTRREEPALRQPRCALTLSSHYPQPAPAEEHTLPTTSFG